MKIDSIAIRGARNHLYYTSYHQLITDILSTYSVFPALQWPLYYHTGSAINVQKEVNVASLAIQYFARVNESEERITQTYNLPAKSLQGAHLVFGGSRQLREKLYNPTLMRKIVTEKITYQIIIWADNRDISVFSREDEESNVVREEPLNHDFFKYILDAYARYDLD